MMMWKLLEAVLGVATVGLAMLVLWQLVDRLRMRKQFGGILDVEREITRRRKAFQLELTSRQVETEGEIATRRNAIEGEIAVRTAELEDVRAAAMHELVSIIRKTTDLERSYAATAAARDRLQAELAALEATADAIATGLCEPSYAPDAPDDHKRRLRELREHQRAMVRGDQAIVYGQTWMLANSRKEGERMQRQHARLLLRAFNGECEAAIAKVRWNNVPRMAERLVQAFGAINRLGAVMQIQLTPQYRDCKLDELRLEYELDQRRRADHEDQRARLDQVTAPAAPARLDDEPAAGAFDDGFRGFARGSVQIQKIDRHVALAPIAAIAPASGARPASQLAELPTVDDPVAS